MEERALNLSVLNKLKARGAQKAQSVLSLTTQHEFTVNNNAIALLRTNHSARLGLMMIKDAACGRVSSNRIDPVSVDAAVAQAAAMTAAAQPDPAHDIAPAQGAQAFTSGVDAPDQETMYQRLAGLLEYVRRRYPRVIINEAVLDCSRTSQFFANSHGVDFSSRTGVYSFYALFLARDGKRTSSFNVAWFALDRLDRELHEAALFDTLLRQIEEQLDVRPVPEKFTGDIIVTPDCAGDFTGPFIQRFLGDYALISGTSIYREHLGKPVASPGFSLHSRPLDPGFASRYFVTGDGFVAQDSILVEQGILRSFNLSLYGANKTGRARALNHGDRLVVEAGKRSYQDLIRDVKHGILLCRFSGGSPNNNGDFSGVAKNSYYIEDGQVRYPVSETMVAGNLAQLFMQVEVSRERVNNGVTLYPWLKAPGMTISSK